jgi:two-component system NtrC family sensor kinase
MSSPRERILLVEASNEVCDMIARQTLQPMGYRVDIAGSMPAAIQGTARLHPDLIIADLKLPGLSGKDLLVALASQGVDIPVIAICDKGVVTDIIQAFRLGAVDFLIWPVREAEVVSAVERTLKQVRARRERETLLHQLDQANQELQRRVRELTTLFAIGKAVTSITDHHNLLQRIVEGALFVSEADSGWLLLREEHSRAFVLGAQRNLPEPLATRIDQPWDDGVSWLVAISGEPLAIHGEPLKRFKISRLGQSVLVMPVKVRSEVVGLLTVLRKAAVPFGSNSQSLLNAVTDYASISIVNARLFKALEERAQRLQQVAESAQAGEQSKDERLIQMRDRLSVLLDEATQSIDSLIAGGETGSIDAHHSRLRTIKESLQSITQIIEAGNADLEDR